MPYAPQSFRGFGSGLNLRDKADAVSETEAIDALNVEFTERGAVKQRAGYDNFTTTAGGLTNRVGTLHAHNRAGASAHLLAGCGTRLEAIASDGSVVASATGLTDGTWSFARFGTPNSEISYAGQGNSTLRNWNGTAWANTANTPAAGALAVFAQANRLVAARFNTTTGGPTGGAGTSSPSHIYFSDPGSATAWTATNFEQLTPGDGEKIQALIAWREFVFAFKESRFFVFYGESQDSGGGAVFEYRTVDTGFGAVGPKAVCADESGVYFCHSTGIYRTTGGDPERLSDPINPIFEGGSSDYFLGGELSHPNISDVALAAHDDRIYVSYRSTAGSANDRLLAYDGNDGWWSLYDIAATDLISFRPSTAKPDLYFGYASGDEHVGVHSSAYTNDDGAAITSRWRSGWFDYGDPTVKKIRESKVWGTGIVGFAVSHDFRQDPAVTSIIDLTDESVDTWGGTTWGGGTWAEPSGLNSALRRIAVRGTVFSTHFSNSTLNQSWAAHRCDHHLLDRRTPSVKDANPE